MSKFLKSNKKYVYIAIVVVVLIIAGVYFFTKNGNGNDVVVVRKGTIVQSVLATGKIKAVDSVDLGFESSGKVSEVYVNVGDRVEAGQLLAKLDSSELLADLKKAQANVALKRAETGGTETKLDEIKKEQDTLVESAYAKLISSNLEATPHISYGVTAPVITGFYAGSEGVYKIRVLKIASSVNNYELRIFDLENASGVEILDNEPTPLGTKGLFISFPDSIETYNDTTWYISIPNKKSSSYLTNFSSYTEAVQTRARTITEAESRLSTFNGGTTVANAELQSAEAEVAKIQSQISKNSIKASFAGVITKRDIEIGEIVSPNTPVISIVSDNNLEIEAFVSEINISKIAVGNPVSFTLDAFQDKDFTGRVIYVDPAETIIDGVINYKVRVAIDGNVSVKSGLTANLTFVTSENSNVIIIPQYAIIKEGGEMFVNKVVAGEKSVRTQIKTGIVGQGGDTEVISGLMEGDRIYSTIKK